jgi:hypothetical protein
MYAFILIWGLTSEQPFYITHAGLCIYMVNLGLGKHAGTVSQKNLEQFYLVIFVAEIFYNITLTLAKSSAILFNVRIFSIQTRWFLWCTYFITFLVLGWLIGITLLGIFQCTPVDKAWNPTKAGTCLSMYNLYLATAIPNVVIDFFLLLLPLPILWNLRVTLAQKIGLLAVFTLGYR